MSGMRWANSIRVASAFAAAALAVTATSGRAQADAFSVRIDSEPPGATVSLGDGQELGTTPYEGALPAGVHTLIFQRAGYETGVDVIEVRPVRQAQRFSMQLVEVAYGTLTVVAASGAPALDGAQVWVDGENLGEAPGTMQVPAGPHHVEIIKPGFEVFEEWIEVVEGQTVRVTATLEADPDAVITTAAPPSAPRATVAPPLFTAGGGLEFGGRNFRYDNPQTTNLRPYNAGGVPLIRISAELYPLSRTGNPWLTGLAIVGGGGWAFPIDSSTEDGDRIGTSWSDYDIAARALFPVASDVRAGLEAGHGRARFGFVNAGALADEVPDVDYRYARLGAVSSAAVNRYVVTGAASYVSPYEAGATAERFADARVWGMALDASLGSSLGQHFDARITAHYTRFAYTLTPDPAGVFQADGGIDHFLGISLGGFFRY
jgi:hypothetical protein